MTPEPKLLGQPDVSSMWFVRTREGLVVVSGFNSAGRVAALSLHHDGTWVWEPVAELPAIPVGWTLDDGHLVLLMREEVTQGVTPFLPPPRPHYTVLRLTASRKLEAVH
jgi:hypothetical protein